MEGLCLVSLALKRLPAAPFIGRSDPAPHGDMATLQAIKVGNARRPSLLVVLTARAVYGIIKSIVRGRYAAKDTAAQGRFAKGRSLPGLTRWKSFQVETPACASKHAHSLRS